MSKELTAKVTLDVKDATRKLDELSRKIQSIDKMLNKRSSVNTGMTATLKKATRQVNDLDKANQKASNSANQIGKGYKNANKQASILTKNLRMLISTYVGLQGLQMVGGASDTITKAENKFNAMNGNNAGMTKETMDKIYAAAQKSRSGYADMMGNVGKSMTLAPDAFQGNIDNAIRFQEIMAKTYTLGGASAAEQASSMYQLIQGLGSGILQGDELRSVREGAPLAYKAIEEFAQGIFGADKNLKDLASDGLITSDIVVAAIMRMGDTADTKFKDMAMTFEQAWQNIKNTALKAFEPVLKLLNKTLNSKAGQAGLKGIETALLLLADAAYIVLNAFSTVFNWMYDNWYWLKYIVYAVCTSLVIYLGMVIAQAIKAGVIMFYNFLMGLSPLTWGILLVGALVAALVWLANTTGSLCEAIVQMAMFVANTIVAILMVVLVVYLATGAIMLSIPVLIALVVIAVLALLIAAFLTWTEQIVGFAYGLASSLSWIFENISSIWNNILAGMSSMFWTFVADCLSAIQPLVEAFNSIASLFGMGGINISGAIDSAKGKADAANARKVDLSGGLSNAWSSGYSKGASVGSDIKSKIDNFGNKLTNFSAGDLLTGIGGGGLPSASFAPGSGGFDMGKIGKGVGDTADNTGRMADSMEMADEELELLRKMAEMEWKKEYTTANITLDVTNNNSINSDLDMNGIVTILTDTLYEELDSLANGVYPYSYTS